ncbi:hypothetical protein ACFY9G_23335 [Streptomyces anthocyanicus]
MNWQDAILYGPGWVALLLIPAGRWLDRRFRRKYEARWGVPYRPENHR